MSRVTPSAGWTRVCLVSIVVLGGPGCVLCPHLVLGGPGCVRVYS